METLFLDIIGENMERVIWDTRKINKKLKRGI